LTGRLSPWPLCLAARSAIVAVSFTALNKQTHAMQLPKDAQRMQPQDKHNRIILFTIKNVSSRNRGKFLLFLFDISNGSFDRIFSEHAENQTKRTKIDPSEQVNRDGQEQLKKREKCALVLVKF
jgi:hypothetical protein